MQTIEIPDDENQLASTITINARPAMNAVRVEVDSDRCVFLYPTPAKARAIAAALIAEADAAEGGE